MKEEFYKKLAAVTKSLPAEPPKDTLSIVLQRGLLNADLALYRAKGKKAWVRCTACGREYTTDYINTQALCRAIYYGDRIAFQDPGDCEFRTTGDTCYCPYCEAKLKVLHTSRFGASQSYTIDHDRILTVHNTGGTLALLTWVVTKNCDREGNVYYDFLKREGVVFINGIAARVSGIAKYFYANYTFKYWEPRKKYEDYVSDIEKYNIMPFEPDVVHNSDIPNCALLEYIEGSDQHLRIRPAAYLKLYCKHNQVENLVKNGYANFVEDLIMACGKSKGYYRSSEFSVSKVKLYIDTKAKRPHQILGVEKEHLHQAKELPFAAFQINRLSRMNDKKELSRDILEKIQGNRDEFWGYLEFFSKSHHGYTARVEKTVRYILRRSKTEGSKRSLSYLEDYWDMLYKVYDNMEPSMLYPKNLEKAHDDMQKRLKEKADAILSEKIHKQAVKHKSYCFSDEETGLMIFPCDTHKDLINEGKALSHCVAMYADRVAEGKTCILFIRKTSEPDIPYFTLEYKNGVVMQNRGKKNCERTEDVKIFEKKWLEHLEKGKRNGKRKNTTNQRATA